MAERDPRRPAVPPPEGAALEAALAELGRELAFPPTPDLAGAVRRRLAAAPARPSRRFSFPAWPSMTRRGLAAAALALAVLVGAVVGLVPGARSAVADWLGVRGIRIEVVRDRTPTAVPSVPAAAMPAAPATPSLGGVLLLGQPATLDEAAGRVDFALVAPAGTLGGPDEVYVRELPEGPMVSLLWRARPGLPEAAETGVGALLMQFRAPAGAEWLAKRVYGPAAFQEPVTVGGADGYWIFGTSELVVYDDPSLPPGEAAGRPSANVLIWERDGVTYRLETALRRREAVRLAESLGPVGPGGTPEDG